MKGTILDFLKLASENEELGREIGALALKYDFEFTPSDELSEEELGDVTGGLSFSYIPQIISWTPPPQPSGTLEEPEKDLSTPGGWKEPWMDKNTPPGG